MGIIVFYIFMNKQNISTVVLAGPWTLHVPGNCIHRCVISVGYDLTYSILMKIEQS